MPTVRPGFTRIAVACDGTPESDDAAALAAILAEATGAGVSLVGVFPPTFLPIPGVSDRTTRRHAVELQLRSTRDRIVPGAMIHALVSDSEARGLLHYTSRWHADLVVFGSHRGTPVGHAAFGRHARELLGSAPCAIAVAERGFAGGDRRVRRMAVGYDGGPQARVALEFAGDLAAALSAELELATVVEARVPSANERVLDYWARLAEPERAAARDRAQADAAGLRVRPVVHAAVGDPVATLRTRAAGQDLMVIGSRRWGAFARVIAGGVGEGLAADCECSLIIVPRTGTRPADDREHQRAAPVRA